MRRLMRRFASCASRAAFTATLGLALAFNGAAEAAPCDGRIPNPVTDVCWSCMFPIKIGTAIPVSASNGLPDPETDATALCACGLNANLSAGLNFSFWEPLRTAEAVRHPWCFPSLGGVSMANSAVRASAHGRSAHADGSQRNTAFWQVHWYHTPWLFVLEALLDNGCLEQAPWDLAYLSELDPLWDDSLSAFLLAPDAALFTMGAAFGACAVDCISASAGASIPQLYWCSGCQGAVFPISGWMAADATHLQAWELLAHRFALKLSREGLLWSAHGKDGQCGPYLQPILRKDVWRVQLSYPARGTEKAEGACCAPLGRTTAFRAAFKTPPMSGEDGAVLLWRRRDCCMTKSLDAPASPSPSPESYRFRRLEDAAAALEAIREARLAEAKRNQKQRLEKRAESKEARS